MSKDMLGGCCVCSDERGWTENPLVYCDGCNVAVHQACYGIVTVPKGPWFCRKCESKVGRVKCELCPAKDGALKRTDNNKWAHVVCALYIPEVRFGNVTTMEPIIILSTPPERFNRTCYICLEQNAKSSKATAGACMQCNKQGCKQQFHVTCGQVLGLLCEEAGNYMDNVKYCGYCQHHYSKLKKGGNVKTIPPYKPVPTGDHDSSPEKDAETKTSGTLKKSFILTKNANSPGIEAKPKSPSPEKLFPEDEKPADVEMSEASCGLKFGTTSSHPNAPPENLNPATSDLNKGKFTTSNFVETVVTQSEPIFGSTSPDSAKSIKKRKASVQENENEGTTSPVVTPTPTTTASTAAITMKSLSVSLPNIKGVVLASGSRSINVAGLSKAPLVNPVTLKSNLTVHGTGTKITITTQKEDVTKKAENRESPLNEASEPNLGSSLDYFPGKRSRSNSADKVRKPKKTPSKRSGGVSGVIKDEPESPPGSPDDKKGRKKGVGVPPIKQEDKEAKGITLSAPHMLGNQLNPASSVAQKMNDALNQELEAHSIYSQEQSSSNYVPPQLPHRMRMTTNEKTATLSAANSLLSLGNPSSSSTSTSTSSSSNIPNDGLEHLLERQWDQGGQFLMEQAQHFDIASLLSCLHQLRSENNELEDVCRQLHQRRDHLLAVNARLSVPLTNHTPFLDLPVLSSSGNSASSASSGGSGGAAAAAPTAARMENGHRDEGYVQMHPRSNANPPNQPMAVRTNPSNVYSNPQARRPVVSNYQNYQSSQMPSQSMNVRRDEHREM